MRFLILLVVLIAGCADDIPKYELTNAEKICKDRGGVFNLWAGKGVCMHEVTCGDGTKHDMKIKEPK